MKLITKAVFPVAGMGSRFLPATKASPKEMLPIVDKPLIQHAVEEAMSAGITDMIFITGRGKRAIEDHFDKAYEMETELEARGKQELLAIVRGIIPKNVNCVYIRQADPLGLGHAVLCAANVVGDHPFAVILADDLIDAAPTAIQQMVEVFEYRHCSILGVQTVPRAETSSYGIVRSTPIGERLHEIEGIVEKPKPEVAPSNLAVVGRYILTPQIFHHLRTVTPGAGGEIQLTDGIAALLAEEPFLAYAFKGTRYDCGSKLGYLQATIQYGLRHSEVQDGLRAYIKAVAGELG
ncbi:MAG: UTP--glucose-1-phosphate uridylyltransferase GalU [Burkholderiales bacterium]|nr:UTP--glucose-1-phosphate uridylyltransferase GalU [Burkholderiales bacterium]